MADRERRDSSGSGRQFPDCRCRTDRRSPGRRLLCPACRLGRNCRPKLTAFMPRSRPREPLSSCCACRSCSLSLSCWACLVLVDRWLKRMPAWGGTWRRFFALVVAAALALVIGFIAARLLGGAGLPLRTLRLWTVVAVVGPIILAAVQITPDGIAANRVPGALRPSDGVGARPLARHWLGNHRRYAVRDIAALEHRAGSRGSDPNRFGQFRSTFCLPGWCGGTDARWPPPSPVRAREAVGAPALPNYGRQS